VWDEDACVREAERIERSAAHARPAWLRNELLGLAGGWRGLRPSRLQAGEARRRMNTASPAQPRWAIPSGEDAFDWSGLSERLEG